MQAALPDAVQEPEDWIANLLQHAPQDLSMDALETDPQNILLAGQGLSGLTDAGTSDLSSQSQLQQPYQPDVSPLSELDLPELDELLGYPLWQDLISPSECGPDCNCEQPAATPSRSGRRVGRKQPRPPEQLLTSWTTVKASPSSSGSAAVAPDTIDAKPSVSDGQAKAAVYPGSSQDSSHRPASPAEAFRDTSCTPAPRAAPSVLPPVSVPALAEQPATSATANAASAPQPPFQFGQRQPQQPEGSSAAHSEVEPEEAKRAARMQRNRESAHYSRQRKKMQTHDLEHRCRELQTHNTHLTGLVNQLTAEVGMLRHQLVMTATQGGTHMPMAPPVPGQYPYGSVPMPVGMQPAACAPTPKVPIQKLKPSRPAPAPTSKAAQNQQQTVAVHGSAGSRPNKRAKTIAAVSAGTTAMLALCCVLVISSPGSPGSRGLGGSTSHAALPAIRGPGRALQALSIGPVNDSSTQAALGVIQEALEGANMTEWAGGDAPPWQSATNTSAWDPVTLRPLDRGAEALALQYLKDLAPVATISDWAQQSQARSLANNPQFHSFPQLAGSVLGPAGLLSPATCREVFSFDATSLVDVGEARASLKRHLANLSTFRGRNLGALPLPPIGGSLPSSPEGESSFDKRPKQTIGCGQDSEVVVSVLLPTRHAVEGESPSLTSLDQIFVVMLRPGKQYVTYSCGLDKPVFA